MHERRPTLRLSMRILPKTRAVWYNAPVDTKVEIEIDGVLPRRLGIAKAALRAIARFFAQRSAARVGGHDWKAELSAKIVSLQRPDGSWLNENNRFWEADPVLCTSFAMIALTLCR